ncbi:hypothetical protein [Legionella hackeliae]|uniref:Uncharacterized protein n=1 Tax=Legionella hackeliae TaxID=449 RepID=A0A0A8UVL3_LEGHA|nr:hypothetical protein [Legionella hackeliae]KTD13138.1 hypothetical protein Lhac_1007 [Legionella hackeliae]CEK11551.1 conserved protein of unknown function [Legionella hackeliae]STX48322.1 Uncharacterised protein [Legionella hackeliae]
MGRISTILQYIYGGKDFVQPQWQLIATQHLKKMNEGYHLGRFINCIEITVHAYKAITTTKGNFFPNVTPLPSLPPLIPGYMEHLQSRMLLLDNTKNAQYHWMSGCSYEQLFSFIADKAIPLYSHLIVFAKLKKLPGGHALSAIVVPNAATSGFELFFYDAQGFLPDSWLHAEQFDEFYSVESLYVYDSEESRNGTKNFIDKCKSEALSPANLAENKKSKPPTSVMNYPALIKEKLKEFVELELFRLEAKFIVASGYDTSWLQKKMEEYERILDELFAEQAGQEIYLMVAKLFIQTAKLVKNHSYSYNWFDPQSLKHFRLYFEKYISLEKIQTKQSIDEQKNYIASYLICEIMRLSLLNEYTNIYIDKKVDLYLQQLKNLFSKPNTTGSLIKIIKDISKISSIARHWFSFYGANSSSIVFDTYIKPLQKCLVQSAQQTLEFGGINLFDDYDESTFGPEGKI